MRAPTKLSLALMALSAAACATGAKTDGTAAADDFKRDLQLASATNMSLAGPAVNSALLTSLETAPGGAPKAAKVIKEAETGDRAVHSEAPTVTAAPEPTPAPVEETTQPVVTAQAPAPVPVETDEPVAVAPRPMPAPVMGSGQRAGDYGVGGGVLGGAGSVIRGGGVGGDHCDTHGRGGLGVIFRSGVFVPQVTSSTTRGVSVRRMPAVRK